MPADKAPNALTAKLEGLILALPWNDSAPSTADAVPAVSVKGLLARDMARTLLVEGLSNGQCDSKKLKAQRTSELRALNSIAQGRITKTVRSKLHAGTGPGSAVIGCYLDLGYTDAAIAKAAAIVDSEAKMPRRKMANHQALNIARRCRQVYEVATDRPGNLSASAIGNSDRKRYVGLYPFVASVFGVLGIAAKAAGAIKTIELERRAGTKTILLLELSSPDTSASIPRDGARLPRVA